MDFVSRSVSASVSLGLLITTMLAGVPTTAAAQEEVFLQRLADLTNALEGTYGDEGPRIGELLDQMSRALAGWDRHVARATPLQSAQGEGDAVKAYYLLHRPPAIGKTADLQAARATLAARYRRLLTARSRPQTPPFPESAINDRHASDIVLPLAAYARAYERIARGAYDEAIDEFRKAAAADSLVTNAASEIYRRRALTLWAASDDDKSIEQLNAAVRTNPHDERSRLTLFQVLRMAGRDAESARTLEEATRVLPDSMRAHWWLGVTYERLNRFVDARRELEHAVSGVTAGRNQAYVAIGRLAAREADLPAAAAAFARSIDADPNDSAAHKYLASVFLQQDRTADALVEWTVAVLIDPLDADAHAGIGQLLLNMDRADDAIAALRRAVELSPDHTEARYALAVALTRVGKTQEADREFARVEAEQRRALEERRRKMAVDVANEQKAVDGADRGAPR
jgi:tetratricopeptide (TPR) repeat protein